MSISQVFPDVGEMHAEPPEISAQPPAAFEAEEYWRNHPALGEPAEPPAKSRKCFGARDPMKLAKGRHRANTGESFGSRTPPAEQ